VRFPSEPASVPDLGRQLADGKVSAAILPEPFASQAEQQYGAVPLADLSQGATSGFPVAGYAVTRQWAARNPNTLKRFLAALETGQQISDINRSAVEQAFTSINGPGNGQVTPAVAAVMALDDYPIGVNPARIQRVADAMLQFGLLKSPFKATSLVMPAGTFDFTPFSAGT
jgi:NitT/TauT family transport system substrate-binding protein